MAGARSIFGELSYAPPASQFVGGVNVNNSLDRLGTLFDRIDNRPIYSTNSLYPDSAVARAKDAAYETGIDEAAASGDPYRAQSLMIHAAKQRAADLANSNTHVGAITKSVAERQAGVKRIDDLSDKEFDKTYANLALERKDREFAKRGGTTQRKDGLGFQTYGEVGNIAARKDINDAAKNLGEGFKADVGGTEGTFHGVSDGPDKGLYRTRNGVEREKVDPQDILQVVGNGLLRDGQLSSSLKQDAEKEVFGDLLSKGATREQALDALNEGKLTVNGQTIDVNKLLDANVQSKVKQASIDMAVKYGYKKEFFTSDEHNAAGADELVKQMGEARQQQFYDQVRSNPEYAKQQELADKPSDNFDFAKYLQQQGITHTGLTDKTGRVNDLYTDANGNYVEKSKIEGLVKQYKAFKSTETLPGGKNQTIAQLDELSKDNPLLAGIYKDQLKKEGGSKTLYKNVQERYNSKLQSVSTIADKVYAPPTKQLDDMQQSLVGKDGGLGLISQLNVRTAAGFVPFNTWAKDVAKIDLETATTKEIEDLQKSLHINGTFAPNSDGAQIAAKFKGQSIALTGSIDRATQTASLQQVHKVLTDNIDKVGSPAEPIDFSAALNGLPLQGYAEGKDKWNGNKHEGRSATIHITKSIPSLGINAGDTISFDKLLEYAREADISKNFFLTTGANRAGDVATKGEIIK